MTDCRNCRRDTELFLCRLCAKELHALLADLPWLCRQLQITVTRQDKLGTAVVGRGSDNPSPINVGAMELARNLHNQLGTWVRGLAEDRGVTALPADTGTAGLAQWLCEHIGSISCSPEAGVLMREIRGGTEAILAAINRSSRMYCGPCTTVRGHDPSGQDVECGHDLYADRESPEDIQCPRCKVWVNPREQLLVTIRRRDLLPERHLLETMETIGEPVSRVRLYDWIRSGRLRPRGWVHHGRVVSHQVQRGDARVFSLEQARRLRADG